MEAYFQFLESDGRSSTTIRDARYRAKAFIRPKLSSVEAAALTTDRLRHWRDDLVRTPPRLRPGASRRNTGADRRRYSGRGAHRPTAHGRFYGPRSTTPSVNGKIASDAAWRKVKPFKGVDAARHAI